MPIIPDSLRHDALHRCHDSPVAGHQGIDKSMKRLRQVAYWVNMARDVEKHCRECLRCQQSKLPKPNKAPLVSMPIGKPWQMVAVDVLEVPISTKGNRYLLVLQDYFTKWADAILLKNQTAATITEKLIQVFSVMGLPSILHSDQGRNFESTLLQQMLDAFGTSRTFQSLTFADVSYLCRQSSRLGTTPASHSLRISNISTLVHRYRTICADVSKTTAHCKHRFGTSCSIRSIIIHIDFALKMAELKNFVESNQTTAAAKQKRAYDKSSTQRSFKINDPVWLSIPTAGKLDPKWEGDWKVVPNKVPVNVMISDGRRTKVVHINRVRHRTMPSLPTHTPSDLEPARPWCPLQMEHFIELDSLR